MKKHILAVTIAALPALALAAPSDNTINFQGEVTDQTCQVTINGNTGNATVLLPTVTSAALNTMGQIAGRTRFTVGLSDCMAPTFNQTVDTVFIGNQTTPSGNLANTGSATNVELQLLDPNSPTSPFVLSNVNGVKAPGLIIEQGSTSASYDFAVQYVTEEGGAMPGSVLGSVQYAVVYH
ncbi:MAG TPA: fimbrial protein [Paraburkholderia sp.]|jgi:major type 1 subunit fimbrin (pilin)|nr:fimbrial protein [Paraburkholderia sp.]